MNQFYLYFDVGRLGDVFLVFKFSVKNKKIDFISLYVTVLKLKYVYNLLKSINKGGKEKGKERRKGSDQKKKKRRLGSLSWLF